MQALSYPLHNSHMLKSRLINISVSANIHPATVTPSKQPNSLVEKLWIFSHGGENDLRRARIPLGNGVA